MRDQRIKYFAPADYRDGSSLDTLVKLIIDRTAANEVLENVHYDCHDEFAEADKAESEEQKQKSELIMALESSDSFARTHSVVAKLKKCSGWSADEKEQLFDIAVRNSQVLYILSDADVNKFYQGLLEGMTELSENASKVKERMGKE